MDLLNLYHRKNKGLFGQLANEYYLQGVVNELKKNVDKIATPPTPKLPANIPPYVSITGKKQPVNNMVVVTDNLRHKNNLLVANIPAETITHSKRPLLNRMKVPAPKSAACTIVAIYGLSLKDGVSPRMTLVTMLFDNRTNISVKMATR